MKRLQHGGRLIDPLRHVHADRTISAQHDLVSPLKYAPPCAAFYFVAMVMTFLPGCDDKHEADNDAPPANAPVKETYDQTDEAQRIEQLIIDEWSRVTILNKTQMSDGALVTKSQEDIERILRLIESSLGVQCPRIWRDAMLTTHRRDGRNMVSYQPFRFERGKKIKILTRDEFSSCERHGDVLWINSDEVSCRLVDVAQELNGSSPYESAINSASAVFRGSEVFVVLYQNFEVVPADVYCVDYGSGRTIWKSPLKANRGRRRGIFFGTFSYEFIIDASDQWVVAFGLSNGTCSLEAVDCQKGKERILIYFGDVGGNE